MKYRILICYWLSCFGVQCLDECWHDNKLLLRVQAYKDVYSPMTFKCNLNLKVNRTEEVSLALTIVMEKKIKYKYSSFCTSIFCPVSYKSKFESCENHVRKRCHFVHSTLYHFFTRVWARSQCVAKVPDMSRNSQSLLSIGKERTNMAVSWGAQVRRNKTYFCCLNIDNTSKWSMEMRISDHFLHWYVPRVQPTPLWVVLKQRHVLCVRPFPPWAVLKHRHVPRVKPMPLVQCCPNTTSPTSQHPPLWAVLKLWRVPWFQTTPCELH